LAHSRRLEINRRIEGDEMENRRSVFSVVRTLLLVLGFLFAVLALPSHLMAQSSDGTLVGVVTDPSGAAVPKVTVKAISPQFGALHQTVTDDVGAYRMDALQPGTYSVTFVAPGFAELQVGSVILSGSVTTTVNGNLKVGTTSKTIVVEATAGQVIDTQSGQLGESLGTTEIESLPYTSFNPAELAMTLPGVQDTEANNSFSNGIDFSVNGTRPRANNFLIDGQDDNDWSISGQAFQPDNIGAIQEFTVLTNAYGAEYGRGGGSVSNYIYKSGTNNFHGDAWEVNQNSAVQAIPSQNKFLGDTTNPLFNENTFGFDVGGPVIKDKLFAFGTIQWNPTAQRATGNQLTLPTAAGVTQLQTLLPNPNVQLLLSALGGLTAPENPDGSGKVTSNPGNAPDCIALGPGPNGVDRGCVQSGLFERTGVREEATDTNWNLRLDYHTGPNDVIFGSFIRQTGSLLPDFFNNAGALPEFDSQQAGTTNVFRGGWTHTFSSAMVNELRFSYTNIGFSFNFPSASLAGPLAGIPGISFGADSNYPTLGLITGLPQGRAHKVIQAQDAMTYTYGRHTIKGGVDVTFLSVTDQVPFNNRGTISYALGGTFTENPGQPIPSGTFSSLANYVDDFIGGSPGAISKVFGNPTITPNVTVYAPYVEDTWKVKENLTFTAGLRYEYWGTLGNTVQFPSIQSGLTFGVAGATFPNSFGASQQGDTNNFGPRLGFAYTPHWGQRFFGHDATVIRAGYGIFYDGLFTNIVDNTAASSPNATGANIRGGSTTSRGQGDAMAALAAITGTPNSLTTIETMSSHLKNPLTQQWNLDVQRELPGKMIVTAAYVGTRGERLFVNQDFNPGTGNFNANGNAILSNPNFGEILVRTNGANSWYNAGQVELERRFHTDLTLRAAYTYSKFLDDGSEVFTTTTSGLSSFAQNLRCQICDWGASTYDRRHRFVLSYVYALPRAKSNWLERALTDRWQWSGIATLDSGSPDTPFDGFDNQGNDHPNTRPDLSNPSAPLTSTGIDGTQLGLTTTPGTFFPLSTCFFGNPGPCAPQAASTFRFIIPAFNGLVPGTAGRNSIYGPGQWFFDTSIGRRFPIPMGKLENQSIEFRTEFFDAFNHGNLFTPSYNLISSQYDDTAATVFGGRTIKFWLKYSF
jgi:outer membrane receptor protein involved in Fe transport